MASFICYRGESVDNGIGLHIAAQLYELIRNDPSFQPVFFSPEHKDNDFIKDACNFISEADNLFVILSPNFFKGFERDGKIDPESVTYHELRTAFANPNCTFRVIRTYGFEWNDSTLESLSRFYPDCELSRLTHRTGLVLQGDALCAPDIARFRQKTDLGDPIPMDREQILEDLFDCVSTPFAPNLCSAISLNISITTRRRSSCSPTFSGGNSKGSRRNVSCPTASFTTGRWI